MPEDEIRPSDMHCGGCDFYLGLEECVLPPGCCILTDPDCFEASSDWDGAEQIMKNEGGTP